MWVQAGCQHAEDGYRCRPDGRTADRPGRGCWQRPGRPRPTKRRWRPFADQHGIGVVPVDPVRVAAFGWRPLGSG